MKSKNGAFCQRIGALIEDYICDEYNLFYNKRQRTIGYYDAYNATMIYEIKASKDKSNRILLTLNNHKKLMEHNGKYIFVLYKLENSDKVLRAISDIKIQRVSFVSANTVDGIINESGQFVIANAGRKEMVRIRARHVFGNHHD